MADIRILPVERSEQGIQLPVQYGEHEARFAYPPKEGTHRECFQALHADNALRAAQGMEYALLTAGAYTGAEDEWREVRQTCFIERYVRMPSRMLLIPRRHIAGDASLSGVLFEDDVAGAGLQSKMQSPDLSHWTQREGIFYAPLSSALFIPSTAYEGKSFEQDGIAWAHFSSAGSVTQEGAALFSKTAQDAGKTPYNRIAQRMKEITQPEQQVSLLFGSGRLGLGGNFWVDVRDDRAFGVVRAGEKIFERDKRANGCAPYEVKSASGFLPGKEQDIEIGDVRIKMPTEAETQREQLRSMIDNTPMNLEWYEKAKAALEALRKEEHE